MTGKNPGKHGIFEFVRRDPRSDREVAVNASYRHGDAIWDILGNAGKKVIVHNFPCTYPPHHVNGILISDFMTPRDRRDYTYPRDLLQEIESRLGPYRLHLSQTYSRGNVDNVLDELFDELEYKARVAEYLMTEKPWDAFFQYFWGTDRIQHELWHIIDECHPRHDPAEASQYKDKVYRYFARVDEIVGRLTELAGNDAMVWIASDHGFGPVHHYCSFNIWMINEGFLKLKRAPLSLLKRLMFNMGVTPELAFRIVRSLPLGRFRPSRGVSSQPGTSRALKALFLSSSDIDWNRTQAFSKGNYGQIYINLKGREPHGSVDQADYTAVCNRIVDRLRQIQDPAGGGPWLDQVSLRGEIYDGPLVDNAPDICFLPKDMRYLSTGNTDFTSNRFIVPAFGISGSHRMNGVLVASGGPIKCGVSTNTTDILDVAPTLLYLCDQSLPADMDGRVLAEMIDDEFSRSNPIRRSSSQSVHTGEATDLSAEENDEIIERLKALGYVG
jgi:predicted AlkP superfamily phosphohydrolase/phosphomutase